jgi:hypothetical protein
LFYVIEADKKTAKCVNYFNRDFARLVGKMARSRRVNARKYERESLHDDLVSKLVGKNIKQYFPKELKDEKTIELGGICYYCGAGFVYRGSDKTVTLSNSIYLLSLRNKYIRDNCEHNWDISVYCYDDKHLDYYTPKPNRSILRIMGYYYSFKVVLEYMNNNAENTSKRLFKEYLSFSLKRGETVLDRNGKVRNMMYELLNILRNGEKPLESQQYKDWVSKYFPE